MSGGTAVASNSWQPAAVGARLRAAMAARPEAVAAAAIVALYMLTRLLLLWRMPHFIDEGTHARWTYDAYHHPALRFESTTIGKEPLLIWIAAGFMKLGANPLTAIRLVTFSAGLVSMSMIALLARRIGGNRLALAAAAIYVVLPFVFVHDVIGIMDPLIAALLALAVVLQLQMAERPRLDIALGLGLVMGAAVLTKESGKVAVVMLPLSLLLFDWRSPARLRRLASWLGCAAISLALTGIGLLILHLSPQGSSLHALRSIHYFYPVRSLSEGLAHPIRWWDRSWHVYRPALVGYLTIPLLIAFAVGVWQVIRKQPRLGAILLAWIVVAFGAATLLPINPYPRHLLYGLPPAVVLIALGGDSILRYAARRVRAWNRWRAAVAALATLALAPALIFDASVLANPSSAHYPSNDDEQYVSGFQSGVGYNKIAATLRRLAHGRLTFVAYTTLYTDSFGFLLMDDPNIKLIADTSPSVGFASYLVEFPAPKVYPDFAEGGLLRKFRLIQTVHRPRSNYVLRLYARK